MLDALSVIVETWGKVVPGVRQRVGTADRLGVVRCGSEIVGVAAVKNPAPNYRARCFRKAASTERPEDYPLEIGWIVMHPDHREGRKISPLVADIIDLAKARPLFATTASAAVIHMLTKGGFTLAGSTYPSDLGDETLTLLLRRPDA